MNIKQRLKQVFCIIGLLFFSLYSVDSIAVVNSNTTTIDKSKKSSVITQTPVFSNSYVHEPESATKALYSPVLFLTKTYPYILKTKYGSIVISNASQEPKDLNDMEDGDIPGTVIYETVGGSIRSVFTNELIKQHGDVGDDVLPTIMEEANKGLGGRDAIAAIRLLGNLELLGVDPNIAEKKVLSSMKDPKNNKPDNMIFDAAKDAGLANDAMRKAGYSTKQQITLAADVSLLGADEEPGRILTPELAEAIDKVKKGKKDKESIEKLANLVAGATSSGANAKKPGSEDGQIPGFGNPSGSKGTVPQNPNTGNSNTNSSGSGTNSNTGNSRQNSTDNSNRNSSTDKVDKVTNVGGGGRQQTGSTGTNSESKNNSSGTGGATYTVTADKYTTEEGSVVVEFNRSGGNDGNDGDYTAYYFEDEDGWHYYVENSEGELVGAGDKAPPKTAKAGDATGKVVKDEAILPGADDPKGTETTPRDRGAPLPPYIEGVIKSAIVRMKQLANNDLWTKGKAGSTNSTPTPDGTDGRPGVRIDRTALLRTLKAKKLDMIGNPGAPVNNRNNTPPDIKTSKPASKDDGRTDPPRN